MPASVFLKYTGRNFSFQPPRVYSEDLRPVRQVMTK